MQFNVPVKDLNNNLVQTFKLRRAKWKDYDAEDLYITVTFDALPGNPKDWLAIGRSGDDGYLNYEYTDGMTSGTQLLRAPAEPGAYEVRAYFDDATGDRTVRATARFQVELATAAP